jgi:hypothetical protein
MIRFPDTKDILGENISNVKYHRMLMGTHEAGEDILIYQRSTYVSLAEKVVCQDRTGASGT